MHLPNCIFTTFLETFLLVFAIPSHKLYFALHAIFIVTVNIEACLNCGKKNICYVSHNYNKITLQQFSTIFFVDYHTKYHQPKIIPYHVYNLESLLMIVYKIIVLNLLLLCNCVLIIVVNIPISNHEMTILLNAQEMIY